MAHDEPTEQQKKEIDDIIANKRLRITLMDCVLAGAQHLKVDAKEMFNVFIGSLHELEEKKCIKIVGDKQEVTNDS